MGLNAATLDLILELKSTSGDLGDTITFGRQDFLVSYPELEALLHRHGIDCDEATMRSFYTARNQFSEPILEFLGAARTESMDMTAFEGATIQHDLCRPIDDSLKEQFDLVMDFGTLEHVFNFPQGIRNAMELAKAGGRVLCVNPANNFMGHGFYQFSPELMYRVFSPANGFTVERMVYMEGGGARQSYDVVDPEVVRQRVETVGVFPGTLAVLARRTEVREIFEEYPQQSDYSAEWRDQQSKHADAGRLHFWNGLTEPEQISEGQKLRRRLRAPLGRLKRRLIRDRVLAPRGLTPDPRFFRVRGKD